MTTSAFETLHRIGWLLAAAGMSVGTTKALAQHGVGDYWTGPERQVTDPAINATAAVGRKIAVDSQGTVHVVYFTVPEYHVYHIESHNHGVSWSLPEQLDTEGPIASGPNIVVESDDTLHVAWVNRSPIDGSQRVYYRRRDPVSGWESGSRDLSGSLPLDVAGPSLSVDLSGNVHIAFHTGDADSDSGPPTRVYYMRSLDGGDTFSTPDLISPFTGEHCAWPRFDVAGTNADIVPIVWRDHRRGGFDGWDIYGAFSDDGGDTFTVRLVATPDSGRDWDPAVLVDDDGVIHAVYTNIVGIDGTTMYRRSTSLGATWEDEVAMSGDGEPGIFSSIAFDAAHDTLWHFWKDERDRLDGDPRPDVIITHSTDGGLTWADNEFVTDLGDLDSRFPGMAIGPSGAPYVIWTDIRDGVDNQAMFLKQRLLCNPAVDRNRDGVLNFFDVQVFLAEFSAGEPAADMNDDGVLDFFDVQAFLSAFSAGCA